MPVRRFVRAQEGSRDFAHTTSPPSRWPAWLMIEAMAASFAIGTLVVEMARRFSATTRAARR